MDTDVLRLCRLFGEGTSDHSQAEPEQTRLRADEIL